MKYLVHLGRDKRLRTDWDALARDCMELSAFVSAGIPPRVAWDVVCNRDNHGLAASNAGIDFGIAWRTSCRLGAPVASTCALFAEAFADFARIQREVDSSIAGPRMAGRVMLTLPAVGVLLSATFGLNSFAFLLGSTLGSVCLMAGIALIACALWWSRRLIASVHTRDVPLCIDSLVLSSALRAGVGARTAMGALDDECDAAGHVRYSRTADELSRQFSDWGIPLADLVEANARQARQRETSLVRARANELAERLLVPLGACVLPAFILLSVVPIVFQLIEQTGMTWSH